LLALLSFANNQTIPTPTMLRQFLIILFAENERLAELYRQSPNQSCKPFTDDELEHLVRQQFSADSTIIASLDNLPKTGSNNRIRIWRSEHNRGLWSVAPQFRSFQYGDQGMPINRHGNILDDEAIAEAILHFPFSDPRKERYASASTESRSGD
jgi:hypothetical protein